MFINNDDDDDLGIVMIIHDYVEVKGDDGDHDRALVQ